MTDHGARDLLFDSDALASVVARWHGAIRYSARYSDETQSFRHVEVPKEIADFIPKGRTLSTPECLRLGITQSPGWCHYSINIPQPNPDWHVLLFKRPRALDEQFPVKGAPIKKAATATKSVSTDTAPAPKRDTSRKDRERVKEEMDETESHPDGPPAKVKKVRHSQASTREVKTKRTPDGDIIESPRTSGHSASGSQTESRTSKKR